MFERERSTKTADEKKEASLEIRQRFSDLTSRRKERPGRDKKMASVYNVDEEATSGDEQKIPSVEIDFRRAKKFLLKHSPESGDCLYDHLAELLEKLLAERPKNAVDVFEEYSRKIKDERFKSKSDYLRDRYVPPAQYEEAKKFMELYQALKADDEEEGPDGPEEDEKDDDPRRKPPDVVELFSYLEQIDVALPRSEIVALNLSIRKLVAEKPIGNVRFWGKIIGKPKNYYIVEAELVAEELLARRTVEAEAAEVREEEQDVAKPEVGLEKKSEEPPTSEAEEKIPKTEESTSLKLVFPPLPKSLWKPLVDVPVEAIGSGLNGKIYYACNSPGIDDWMELPSVTPRQIVGARQIVRMCTGDPETPIHTIPPFPGTEKNYLRAQIARISASTIVSPIGFFTFGEGLDEEDEAEADTEIAGEEDDTGLAVISENRHYEPLPLKELIDPSMANWCHHSPYILDQGRTVWWDPRKETARGNDDETDVEEEDEEEEEEEEEEIERENGEFIRKEVGPPLLTPLSEDASLGSIQAWTARASSPIKLNRTAIAMVRSNIWPGSFAFARGKIYGNVYIGMGQKFSPYNYSPPGMPMIQEQYNIGPEILEIKDPSIEAEEAYRIAHLPPSKPGPLELAGERDESEVEDEDEEGSDDEDVEDWEKNP